MVWVVSGGESFISKFWGKLIYNCHKLKMTWCYPVSHVTSWQFFCHSWHKQHIRSIIWCSWLYDGHQGFWNLYYLTLHKRHPSRVISSLKPCMQDSLLLTYSIVSCATIHDLTSEWSLFNFKDKFWNWTMRVAACIKT